LVEHIVLSLKLSLSFYCTYRQSVLDVGDPMPITITG